MGKRVLIAFFFILLIGVNEALSQKSAQATMRVSVRVVSGVSVGLESPSLVALSEDSSSSLGKITLQGTDKQNVLVSRPAYVMLKNKNGDEFRMRIRSESENRNGTEESILFKAKSSEKMMSSLYQGELKTTVEYF